MCFSMLAMAGLRLLIVIKSSTSLIRQTRQSKANMSRSPFRPFHVSSLKETTSLSVDATTNPGSSIEMLWSPFTEVRLGEA